MGSTYSSLFTKYLDVFQNVIVMLVIIDFGLYYVCNQ